MWFCLLLFRVGFFIPAYFVFFVFIDRVFVGFRFLQTGDDQSSGSVRSGGFAHSVLRSGRNPARYLRGVEAHVPPGVRLDAEPRGEIGGCGEFNRNQFGSPGRYGH
jgi:hypothetical protein